MLPSPYDRLMAVTVERSESVLILSIDRPDERNALSERVADAICSELDTLGETTTRAVIVRGAGETFCAGGDVSAHAKRIEGDLSPEAWADRQERVAEAVEALWACPVPTIAAVDGPAFSEGACLALACDIRLASTTGSIGFGFRRFGQAAACGASWLLQRIVSRDVAAELLYTGELLDAQAAVERGLFTRVVTAERFEDELAGLVATISTGPAAAMQANKQLLDEAHGSLSAAMDAEQRLQRRLAETAEFREGVAAFLEQREPEF